MSCSKTTTQWRRWGSNPRPFGLESSTLPLSHCAPSEHLYRLTRAFNARIPKGWMYIKWRLQPNFRPLAPLVTSSWMFKWSFCAYVISTKSLVLSQFIQWNTDSDVWGVICYFILKKGLYFFCGPFVFFVGGGGGCVSCVSHAFASVHCCLVVTCWELADFLPLVGDDYCILLLSHVVSWVRCGTWLYRFLIFAIFLNLFVWCLFVCFLFICLLLLFFLFFLMWPICKISVTG